MRDEEWKAIGSRYWRGLSVFADVETEEWLAHSRAVGQPLTEEGLRLWLERVFAGSCVVCGNKARGKLCVDHQAAMRERLES